MEYGLEVPIPHLEQTTDWVSLHFSIATTCRAYEEYKKYYKKQAEHCWLGSSDKKVMLDNGAYEVHANDKEGVTLPPMTSIELFELALEINPQIVMAPDVLFDKRQSEHLSNEFLDLCKKESVPWQIGYIPQGDSVGEIAQSANRYGHRFDLIALSFLNPREYVIPHIWELLKRKPLHMLGVRDMEEMSMWPRITSSYDTSKPLKAANLNKEIMNLQRGEGLLLPTTEIDNMLLAMCNIQTMKRYAKCLT